MSAADPFKVQSAEDFMRESNRELIAKQVAQHEQRKAAAEANKPKARQLAALVSDRSETDWMPGLEDVLERGVIGIVAGPHGTYKTSWVRQLALETAVKGTPVFICDGEPAGADRNFAALLQDRYPTTDATRLPVHVMQRRLVLNEQAGFDALRGELRAVGFKNGLCCIDTFSKYVRGLDANDNSAVSEFVGVLDALRREFASTILLICHTGKADGSRARGASSLEDDTEACYIVSKDGEQVRVTRDRFKQSASLPPLCFAPRVVELGYSDRRGKPVTGVVLDIAEPSRDRPGTTADTPYERAVMKHARTRDQWATYELCAVVLNEMPKPNGKRDQRRTSADRAINSLKEKGLLHVVPDTGGEYVRAGATIAADELDFLA